jgi:hypothetical protein
MFQYDRTAFQISVPRYFTRDRIAICSAARRRSGDWPRALNFSHFSDAYDHIIRVRIRSQNFQIAAHAVLVSHSFRFLVVTGSLHQ